MRKLLSLLSVLTMGTLTATNVVACGGKSTGNGSGGENQDSPNMDENKQDVSKLLELVDTIIKEQVQKIVDDEKHLITNNFFADGDEIKKDLSDAEDNKEITSETVKKNYFTLIENIIKSDIVPALQENEKLKQLFYGVDVSEILKLDANNSTITKDKFDYSAGDGRFNISNFDPKKFSIDYWFKLNMELSLILSYRDLDGNLLARDYHPSSVFYYSNNNADISGIMYAAAQQIDEKLPENYIVEVDSQDQDIIKNQALDIVTKKIKDDNVHIDDLEINTTNLNFVSNVTTLMKEVILADQPSIAITILKNELEKSLDKYSIGLDSWLQDNKIDSIIKSSIYRYGSIKISNWNVFGLTLKTKEIKIVSTNKQKNVWQWVNNNAALYGKLWNKNGLTKNLITISSDGFVDMKINPDDFDKVVNGKLFSSDMAQIVSNYLTNLAIKEKLITKSEKLFMDFNNVLKVNDFNLNDKKVNDTTIILPYDDYRSAYLRINLYSQDFFATLGTQTMYGWKGNHLNSIALKRAETNVWPTT